MRLARWAALRAAGLALLLVLVAAPASADDAAIATVVTEAGARYPFHVEIADTPAAQRRGLMFRAELAEDAGMLFIFKHARVQSFWMKNTEIPLDMLFIAADGRIRDLHRDAVPFSTRSISSHGPALAVLEIPGGTAARLGIRVGDLVEHPAFAQR